MPNKVHCAHILVKTQREANAVLERLKKGKKFAEIAKEVSLCPSKKRGGDLGTFGRGKMVKEFEALGHNLTWILTVLAELVGGFFLASIGMKIIKK